MICLDMEAYRTGYGKRPHLIVALGNFDGVHIGHQALIRSAKELKNIYKDASAAVWTFDYLPNGTNMITPPDIRASLLCRYGADIVIHDRFERVQHLSHEEFIDDVLIKELKAVSVVCGFNYHFGYKGSGDSNLLRKLCSQRNIGCVIVDKVSAELSINNGCGTIKETKTVSSTAVRAFIESGDMESASVLLGRPYSVYLEVVHGNSLGSKLGFPTMNQIFREGTVRPAKGVYIVQCVIDGRAYPAVTNVGVRPTVSGSGETVCETHIIGFSGDLYGQTVSVNFRKRLRDEKKFGSLTELTDAVRQNIVEAESFFSDAKRNERTKNK